MDLNEVSIQGYRSVRSIRFPVKRLTVLVGGNGVGKTNLYRALQLIHAASLGNFSSELASEGGLPSAFWAGELRKHDKHRIILSVRLDELDIGTDGNNGIPDPTYNLEVGFPPTKAHAAFPQEAEIKTESLTIRAGRRTITMMERKGRVITVRDDKGVRIPVEDDLLASESALASLGATGTYSEIATLCRALSQWRFYHNFRTDSLSPLRQPCPPVTSPTLRSDGSNLAAVFATLRHIRQDTFDLAQAIDDAFPGSELIVPLPEQHATFALTYPDFPHRQFAASELSDGTLQYLALMGALLSYRLPRFMAINEPEASLHPSVLPALGRLIAKAAERTQILVVTHSPELAASIELETGIASRQVIKKQGATWLEGLNQIGQFNDD